MTFEHVTVLRQEVVDHLRADRGGAFVDCTLGGGGHAAALLAASDDVRLIGIDRDPRALEAASERLGAWGERVIVLHGNFANVFALVKSRLDDGADGILFDLGVSSPQLDEAERGFSYKADAPLDMRMDPQQRLSAADIVNEMPEDELVKILRDYGEERWAARIANRIVQERQTRRITDTAQLAQVVKNAIPAAARRSGPHPARRTFQALRIAVNDELTSLQSGLDGALRLLKPGGRIAVIAFHSLEDRIVKSFFRAAEFPCTCPPRLPCVCGNKPVLRAVTSRGIRPAAAEIERNPRSRSATLRVAQRVLASKENE